MNLTIYKLPSKYTKPVQAQIPIYQEHHDPGAVIGHFFGVQVTAYLTSSQLKNSPEYTHLHLISFDSPITTEGVIQYLKENEYLPASTKELIGLYINCPALTAHSHIVAFGQQETHADGCVKIPSVEAYWKWAHQDTGWHLWARRISGWQTFWQFAAVKATELITTPSE